MVEWVQWWFSVQSLGRGEEADQLNNIEANGTIVAWMIIFWDYSRKQ